MKQIKENYHFTKFDKYILFEFIKTYLGALVFFVVIMSFTELLERLDFFQERNVSAINIFLYHLYKTPFFILQFSPIAVLFAVVFSLGMLAKNRELMAVITGGVNFFRVVFYLYLTGLALSIFFIFFNDIITVRTQEITGEMNRGFKGITHRLDKQYLNMYGKGNYIYHITYYHYHEKKMDNVQILKTSKNKERVESRIDAKDAIWNNDKKVWVFHNGIIRHFDPEGNLTNAEPFKEKEIVLQEKPSDFDYKKKDVKELSISSAWKYIKNIEAKGFMTRTELVDFHLKFSFPFACLLMMLIGAPLSLYSSKSVIIISFGFSLLGFVVYWVLLSLGMSLGKTGMLPPFLGVWMSNIFFAFVSYILHKKIAT